MESEAKESLIETEVTEEPSKLEVVKVVEQPKAVIYDMSPVPPGPVATRAGMTHKYTLKDSIKNVFAAKFSPDGNYLAASFADGTVQIHTTFKGDRVFQPKIQKMIQEEHQCPVPRD